MTVSLDVIDGVCTLGPALCDCCGGPVSGEIDAAFGRHGHTECLDRWLSSIAPQSNDSPGSAGEWAFRCPDIRPNQRGTGRIVRKAIYE